ncbi:MAG: GNAT family N-acetyltransferase, partial [Anaerolineae bacterium]|nr:GNAT family N-acetyltransferase [Anaerolineae bacterium]
QVAAHLNFDRPHSRPYTAAETGHTATPGGWPELPTWSIRPYGGTVSDARGLLAVEQQALGECTYQAEELAARLARPEQRVWLAEAQGEVVGFLSGLETLGLSGPRLEADLLAVRAEWRGQGIATALLLALRRQAEGPHVVRGIVNLHNPASSQAFSRAGFRPSDGAFDLLLYRIRGHVPRRLPDWGVSVHSLQECGEAAQFAAVARQTLTAAQVWDSAQQPGVLLLVAESEGTIVAGMELLEVHTVLYSGLWIESILPSLPGGKALSALIAASVEAAKERGLDEVGCLVAQGHWPLRAALLEQGFVPLDSYRVWQAYPLGAERARP